MKLREDQLRVQDLLRETITLLCKNGLNYKAVFTIDALIGVTLDDKDVFLVNVNETVRSGATPDSGSDTEIDESSSTVASPSSKKRKSPRSRKRPPDRTRVGASPKKRSRSKVEHDDDENENDDDPDYSGNDDAGFDDDDDDSIGAGPVADSDPAQIKSEPVDDELVFVKQEQSAHSDMLLTPTTAHGNTSFTGLPQTANLDTSQDGSWQNQNNRL